MSHMSRVIDFSFAMIGGEKIRVGIKREFMHHYINYSYYSCSKVVDLFY